MNDTSVDQACLNLTLKNIQPDARVAYASGLVLGVDEFVQEQRYFLEKDYLHNRDLHGYGTVYGLGVYISNSNQDPSKDQKHHKQTSIDFASGSKIYIQVTAGVGVDQQGRTFVVPETYCVELLEWWNAQGDNKPTLPEGSSTYSIFVRARFDESCADVTALAGQACSNGAATTAYSRISDSVKLDLGLEAPLMSTWDLAQRFALLRSKIWLVPHTNSDIDPNTDPKTDPYAKIKQQLEDYVRISLAQDSYAQDLGQLIAEVQDSSKPGYISLPETPDTNQLLDNLQRTYVIDAIPSALQNQSNLENSATNALPPNPYDHPKQAEQNDILLAEIVLSGDPTNPPQGQPITVTLHEENRPYLLGTQTLQALANIGKRDKNRRRLFADLHVESPTSVLLLTYRPLSLPEDAIQKGQLVLKSDGAALVGTVSTIPMTGTNLFRITLAKNELISVGAPVELEFHLDKLTDTAGNHLDVAIFNDYVSLNDDGTLITIYTFADNLPNVRSLVSIGAERNDTQSLILHLAFDVEIAPTGVWCKISVNGANPTNFPPTLVNPHLAYITLPNTIKDNDHLLLHFYTESITVDGDKLTQFIAHNQVTYMGYNAEAHTIDLSYMVPAILNSQQVTNIVNTSVNNALTTGLDNFRKSLQNIPFATVTPILTSDNEKLSFEIWLHPTLMASNYGDTITLDETGMEIWAENNGSMGGKPVPYSFEKLSTDPKNSTHLVPNTNIMIATPTNQEVDSLRYLRFVFLTNQIQWNGEKLSTFKETHRIKFEGTYVSTDANYDYIMLYVRNTLTPVPPAVGVKRVPAQDAVVDAPAAPDVALNLLAEATPKAAPARKARPRRTGGKG